MLLTRLLDGRLEDLQGRRIHGPCWKKPKPTKLPYENETEQTDSYDLFSIANTPEAQAYLNTPVEVDQGAAQGGDLRKQSIDNQYNNAFTANIPTLFRNMAQNADTRAVDQDVAYRQQAARRSANEQMAARRERLLPQYMRTKTKGYSKGFTTQLPQKSGGGLLGSIIGAAGNVAGGLAAAGAFG